MRILIIVGISIVAVLVVAVIAILLIGWTLPQTHTASRSLHLRRPLQDVYSLTREFERHPEWRSDVKSMEVTTTETGKIRIREDGTNGVINYELVEEDPGRSFVMRITDTDLGFGGSWTYQFSAEPTGTVVTITENGEVTNVLFRFVSKYVFGHTATIDAYLRSIAEHFGEPNE